MNIDCPKCEMNNELDHEDLPDKSCDDNENYECLYCEHIFAIGWVAEAELR